MGYQRGDDRYGGDNWRGGGDRWRDRDQGGDRWNRERGSYGAWGGNRDRGNHGRPSRDDDRGFFERAGEEIRSWFSDDDDRYRGRDEGYARGSAGSSWGGGGGGAEPWGGSGFGGPEDNGRRFDRIDPGHVGAQGAHPMSAPTDSAYGSRYGASGGVYGSSARTASMTGGGRGGIDPEARDRMLGRQGGQSGGYGGGIHDPHYSEWRQRQIADLDRDYDEYRREHQSRFEQEFGGWREKRQTQRQHMGRVTEHMEVVGSDGEHVGTVDKVRGDRIILTKTDESAGGIHHSIPCSWIETVDTQVKINKSSQEAMAAWRNEERNSALFDRDRNNDGSEGPHMLNRSFSGTYRDREE